MVLTVLVIFLLHKASATCPPSWDHYDDSCYLAVDDDVTFPAALIGCKTHHACAYLVSIATAAENNFVMSIAASPYLLWLGLQQGGGGGWMWEDGTPLGWISGSAWTGDPGCASISLGNGDWSVVTDTACYDTGNTVYVTGYVCELGPLLNRTDLSPASFCPDPTTTTQTSKSFLTSSEDTVQTSSPAITSSGDIVQTSVTSAPDSRTSTYELMTSSDFKSTSSIQKDIVTSDFTSGGSSKMESGSVSTEIYQASASRNSNNVIYWTTSDVTAMSKDGSSSRIFSMSPYNTVTSSTTDSEEVVHTSSQSGSSTQSSTQARIDEESIMREKLYQKHLNQCAKCKNRFRP